VPIVIFCVIDILPRCSPWSRRRHRHRWRYLFASLANRLLPVWHRRRRSGDVDGRLGCL